MPEAVLDSASMGLTRTRSSRFLTVIAQISSFLSHSLGALSLLSTHVAAGTAFRVIQHSTAIGTSETMLIQSTTSSKCSFIHGMFPKNHPDLTHRLTPATALMT